MIEVELLRFVEYSHIFLALSWNWLNDSDIKELTLTPDFSKEDQESFYKGLPSRTDYWIIGIEYNQSPIGVMGIKNIKPLIEGEYWGYIGEKNFWGKGIGKLMVEKALIKGKELKLKKIYLNVADFNERAKRLYNNFGFKYLSSANGVEKYEIKL